MSTIPLLAITGYSGTGKTTLLKKLIPLLRQRNIKPAIIKHSHHDIDIDKPGKDSYELRQAGAVQTMIACDQRWALMSETPHNNVDLAYLVGRFDPLLTDLILLEGFKQEPVSKIALFRQQIDKPLSSLLDQYVIALASDSDENVNIPLLNINDPATIADFILQWFNLQKM